MNHVSLISGHNLLWMQPPRVLVSLRMVKGPVWRNSFWVSQWHSFPVTVMNEGSSPPTVCCPFWSHGLCRERTQAGESGGPAHQHGLTVRLSGRCRHVQKGFRPTTQTCSLWALLLLGPFLEWQLEKLYSICSNYHMQAEWGGGRTDYWKQGQWTRWFQNCLGRGVLYDLLWKNISLRMLSTGRRGKPQFHKALSKFTLLAKAEFKLHAIHELSS